MRNGIIKLSFLIQESYTIRSFALEILWNLIPFIEMSLVLVFRTSF
jgi:hypothetical protein